MDEFALIERHFSGRGARRGDVRMGAGDDAAVLSPPGDHELLLTTDTLVAGRHFPAENFPPSALGHRALAVNLSDIAAMGGEPAWALLALTLPEADDHWVAAFADGFAALAERFEVALVGGNLARGPLATTVTIGGFAPTGKALMRTGAQANDLLYVTGALGGGAAGLRGLAAGADPDSPRPAAYVRPEPRIAAGRAVAALADAAIDISDGFLGDLAKVLAASGGLGAELDRAALPLAPGATLDDALGASDDYELLFSVPASRAQVIAELSVPGCAFSRVGRLVAAPGIRLDGAPVTGRGYRHFA